MWLWQDLSRSEHAAVGKQGHSTFVCICGNQKHQNRFLSVCWHYRFSRFTFVLTVLSLNFSIIHDSMTRGLFVIHYTSSSVSFLIIIDSGSSLIHYTSLFLSFFFTSSKLCSSFPFQLPLSTCSFYFTPSLPWLPLIIPSLFLSSLSPSSPLSLFL